MQQCVGCELSVQCVLQVQLMQLCVKCEKSMQCVMYTSTGCGCSGVWGVSRVCSVCGVQVQVPVHAAVCVWGVSIVCGVCCRYQ
jgi:hypothetical protein